MSQSEAESLSSPASESPKKAAKKGKGTPTTQAKDEGPTKSKPKHPKVSDMVDAAIKNLKDRGGSSLPAIKKYISTNYDADSKKLAPFINKYLISAVSSEHLIRTKGKGASGFFKLASPGSNPKVTTKKDKPKSPKDKKPTSKSPGDKKPKSKSPKEDKPKSESSASGSPKKSKKSPKPKAKAKAASSDKKTESPVKKTKTAKPKTKGSPKKATKKTSS